VRRREFIAVVGAAATWPLTARAQQSDKMRLIGVLLAGEESDSAGQARLAAFRSALAKLGWTEGSNLRIEVRWGADPALVARHAADLVALGAEVLVGEANTHQALRRQTHTIPIVFVGVTDPIGQGLVASLSHPGGDITGFSIFDAPMAGKWLGMLTQITPPVARVAVLFDPATPLYADLMLRSCEEAARSLALAVRAERVNNDSEIETAMAGVAREERGGVLVLPSAFTLAHRDAIVGIAAQHRVPAVYGISLFATSGGLMAYSTDITDLLLRAADYVDRILKGAKPGDLPIQQPTKFDLVINLKAAKALGVTISPTLLATADEVIE
jgi:putative ABC transport system substrate-binding protein